MKKRPLCLACIGLMIVICLMKLAGVPILGEPAGSPAVRKVIEDGTNIHVSGQIFRREKKQNSTRYYLKNTILYLDQQEIPLHTIYLSTQTEEYQPVGARILARGTLDRPEAGRNPGQFDARAYYACQKIYYFLWADQIRLLREPATGMAEAMTRLRERLTERTAAVLPESQAGILSAMLWGDKSLLGEDTKINYQYGGVSHVLSISGLHVSLMGLAVYRLLRRILPWRVPAAAAAAACMLWYCLFTGAQVATVRAFVMFAVSLIARLTGRSYDLLCSLSLAGILILLENPGMLFYSGFQLSFTAVLGIGAVSPAVLSLLPAKKENGSALRKAGRRLLENLLTCGSVWGVSLPLTAYYFYEIPFWGTLLNLLMLPFMGPVMILGLAGGGAALLSETAGKILLSPVGCLLGAFEEGMKLLRFLPGGLWICGQPESWKAALCYAGIGLFVLWCRKRKRSGGKAEKRKTGWLPAAAAALCALAVWKHEPAFSVTALDVGQGDCLAVRADGLHFLVDGGSSDESRVGKYRILPYLKQQGIRRLEGIFLTHPDADHWNGLRELLLSAADRETQLQAENLFLPEWMRGTEEERELTEPAEMAGMTVRYLCAGDEIRTENCRIEVLYPGRGQRVEAGEENSASLVLGIHFGEADILLTGDLEGEGEEKLTESLGRYEYLKVAHHGSRNSTGIPFLEAVRPEICVISAPEHSVYGHPHEEVLERIRQSGGKIFCTADCGAVRAVSDGHKIEVFTFLSEYDIL